MNKEVRVLVSMPSSQSIPIYTTKSLMEWQRVRKYPSIFQFKIDTYIDKARNEAVWEAVAHKATHLMFIDSDMSFPSNGVDHLIEQEKDIIGGLYYGRLLPKPMAFHQNQDKTVVNLDPEKEKGNVEVDFVGTGFMLINMKVFQFLEPPFFKITYDGAEFGMTENNKTSPAFGEDVYFCLKAKKHGFKVWCNTDLDLGHIGPKIFTKKDYELYTKNKNLYE